MPIDKEIICQSALSRRDSMGRGLAAFVFDIESRDVYALIEVIRACRNISRDLLWSSNTKRLIVQVYSDYSLFSLSSSSLSRSVSRSTGGARALVIAETRDSLNCITCLRWIERATERKSPALEIVYLQLLITHVNIFYSPTERVKKRSLESLNSYLCGNFVIAIKYVLVDPQLGNSI